MSVIAHWKGIPAIVEGQVLRCGHAQRYWNSQYGCGKLVIGSLQIHAQGRESLTDRFIGYECNKKRGRKVGLLIVDKLL